MALKTYRVWVAHYVKAKNSFEASKKIDPKNKKELRIEEFKFEGLAKI